MPNMLADKMLLLNAWHRVLTSRHVIYRQYQRREIEAFATSHQDLLAEIFRRLRDETYTPTLADRVNEPKDGLFDRTYTLLSLPDWVVYTAIVTIITEAALLREKGRYNSIVFSNFPRTGKQRPQGFYYRWERQYNRFNKACEAAAAKYPFLLDFDLASFYELVDHELLLTKVRDYVKDVYLLDLLGRMLHTWTGDEVERSFGHGLPQGPEGSGFLADLYLFSVDDSIPNDHQHTYVRYVDDIRVFCSSARDCQVIASHLAEAMKRVGLVPNSTKTKIFDTRRKAGWLRQPDYGQFQDNRRRRRLNPRSLAARVQHLKARQLFLAHVSRNPASPRDELRVRRSLTQMLPDNKVTRRIIQVYQHRPDLWGFFFQYLSDCTGDLQVQRFCWRRLCLPATRDWECANLIELALLTRPSKRLTTKQAKILDLYGARADLPMSQAQAVAALVALAIRRLTAKWLGKTSFKATFLAVWLPVLLRQRLSRKSVRRSILTLARRLISLPNHKASLVASYLVGAKLTKVDVAQLPPVGSVYGQIVLNNLARLGRPTGTDEIAPLLRGLFNVRIAAGFDFRANFASIDARWYAQALRHLQLAAWYIDTSPTYFVNHIHNFNHVLWHFALRKNHLIPPHMQWKHSMGQLSNPSARAKFPTMAAVFDKSRVMRNTNLSSHPMDDRRNRFTKLVTYSERDYIKSLLKAAYAEFMTKV